MQIFLTHKFDEKYFFWLTFRRQFNSLAATAKQPDVSKSYIDLGGQGGDPPGRKKLLIKMQ